MATAMPVQAAFLSSCMHNGQHCASAATKHLEGIQVCQGSFKLPSHAATSFTMPTAEALVKIPHAWRTSPQAAKASAVIPGFWSSAQVLYFLQTQHQGGCPAAPRVARSCCQHVQLRGFTSGKSQSAELQAGTRTRRMPLPDVARPRRLIRCWSKRACGIRVVATSHSSRAAAVSCFSTCAIACRDSLLLTDCSRQAMGTWRAQLDS